MKNFTKQITNKTLFKPTRWLLMALMLLLGTSSAWGAIYLKGSFDSWGTGVQFSGDYNCATAVITLNKGTTYDFKINDGSSWYGNGGKIENSITGWEFNSDEDCKITPSTTGEYIFIFYKNSNKKLSVIYPNVGNFYLRGAFNDWSANETSKFTDGKCTISLTSGTYEFKIGTSDWGIGFGKGNTTISEASNSTTMSSVEGNCKIEIPRDGNYTFEFDVKTSNLSVTYPPSCTDPADFTISIDKPAICSGDNATITIPNDHSAESYKWCTKNGNDYGAETPINDKSFTVSAAGNYVVRAYNGNGTCMTESNAVTLTVDNEITQMFIGIVNPNGGYYNTNPLPLCEDQVTLKAWATGAKTYKVYKTSDPNNPVSSGNVTGDGEGHAISYTIEKTNGSDGYLVKFENTCGTKTLDTKTVTVPPTPAVPTLPTQGEKFKRQSCVDHLQHVDGFAGDGMFYMAVLYEGENVTPTKPTNGKTYSIDNEIGAGTVKVIQHGNSLAINKLDPKKIYTLAIYRYNTACYEYSEPLSVTIDKNVPILGELTINGNEFSVPVTKIGANESGVDLNVMKFQYYNEAGKNWADFDKYTVSPSYSKDITVAGGNITATINPGTLTEGQPYKVRACVTNNSCSDINNYAAFNTNEDITYTVPCSTVLKPQLTHNESSVCKSDTEKVNLNTLAGVNNVNWYKGNNKVADPTQVDIKNAGTTIYVVKAVNGLCESEGVEFTLTVNELPTISINADNETPFLNQEVELIASGDNIASVAWSANPGSITPNPDDSKKAILTHSSAGDVTVTATATSAAGCKSAEASYKVNFEAEGECEHEIINNTNKTKVRVKKINNWSTIKIYAHSGQSTGDWPGADMTAGTGEDADYYVYTFESVSSNFKVIFNNGSSNGENQTVSGTATKGKVCTYTIGANSCSEDNNSRRCLTVTTTDYKTNGDVIIFAPAVNTVSVTSQVGSGVVNFTGQVVKTGCAENANIWVGYQYKLATDEWPTTGVTAANQAGANPLVLNPLGHPNGLDPFTADIPLTDGTYDFRAYVINGYDRGNSSNYDQGVYYGLTKRVTVSLQQQAIKTVTINHAAIDGKTITDPTYCAGTTAYIKLTHDGTPYKGDVVWTSTANHDFSKVEGKENLFSYTVKGEDDVTASVKNDENDDYVSSEPLKVKVYPVPNMPNFTIDKTAICSTDDVGAVITVTNPQVGIKYQVYKKVGDTETAHGDAVTYSNGTLTINSIKTAGTYFVKAWNEQCKDKVERSLTEAAVTIVDATANSIAITPTSKEVNPWMPTTFIVTKTGSYNYTLTCTQTNAQVGSATVSSTSYGNIEYNYSFVPTNNGVQVTFTWTNMNDITGAVAPYLQDKTEGGLTEEQGTGNSVTKLIAPNAQGNVIVAAKFAYSGGSQTTADYTYTNQGDAPTSDAIITKKGDTYIIKFPKPADALIDGDGQVTFNPIQYNVTAKLNVDVQGCGTTVATSNVTLTPLTEVCP